MRMEFIFSLLKRSKLYEKWLNVFEREGNIGDLLFFCWFSNRMEWLNIKLDWNDDEEVKGIRKKKKTELEPTTSPKNSSFARLWVIGYDRILTERINEMSPRAYLYSFNYYLSITLFDMNNYCFHFQYVIIEYCMWYMEMNEKRPFM